MGHGNYERPKLTASGLVKIYLVMEGLLSVDLELATGTVVVVREFVFGVLDTSAPAVALVVEAVSIRSIA